MAQTSPDDVLIALLEGSDQSWCPMCCKATPLTRRASKFVQSWEPEWTFCCWSCWDSVDWPETQKQAYALWEERACLKGIPQSEQRAISRRIFMEARVVNRAMKSAILSGDCLDVRQEGQEVEPGVFKLRRFVDGADYCDGDRELWIWSIGRNKATGDIHAAWDGRFYQNPLYDCLWQR